MKKIFYLCLLLVLSLSLASCSNSESLNYSNETNETNVQKETVKTSKNSNSESVIELPESSKPFSSKASTAPEEIPKEFSSSSSQTASQENDTFQKVEITEKDASFGYGEVSTVAIKGITFRYVTVQIATRDDSNFISLGIEKEYSTGELRPKGYLEVITPIIGMSTVKIRELNNSAWTGDILFEVSNNGDDFTSITATSRLEVADGVGKNPQRINYTYDVVGYSYFRITQAADMYGMEYSVNIESIVIE